MCGQPYKTARPIVTQFPGHGCMNILTTECSFDSQTMWVIYVLGVIHWCLYNQALEDVRSTGVGIKILYCTIVFSLSDQR